MPKALNRPTPEQIDKFDAYVRQWQDVLNLRDWRIERGSKPSPDAMADVACNASARLAVYRVGDFGATPVTDEALCTTALHELLHVFLFDLISVAQDRAATPEQLETVEHRVINVLERVLGELHASTGRT